jgi:hemoglobin
MKETNDITTRSDIDRLIAAFYDKAMADAVIGHFFTAVVPLDLAHHLPVIGDFWESLILGNPAYRQHQRNPLQIHSELDAKEMLRGEHFDRWLALFQSTVDELFAGPRAELTKLRSTMIARRMMEFIAASRAARTTQHGEA